MPILYFWTERVVARRTRIGSASDQWTTGEVRVTIKVASNWYEEAFDAWYIAIFDQLRPPEVTQAEVGHIADLLELPHGARILDLGCGYGRHSIALRKASFEVVGLDLSEPLIDKAEADSKGLGIRWLKSDMRSIPFEGHFDAVINNAFGYLEDDDQELKVLTAACSALKPGGKLLQFEIPNKLHWARAYTNEVGHELPDGSGKLIRHSSYDFVTGKEFQSFSLEIDDSIVYERSFSTRIYDLPELIRLYKLAGLQYVGHSALNGASVDFDTQEIAILSCRPV